MSKLSNDILRGAFETVDDLPPEIMDKLPPYELWHPETSISGEKKAERKSFYVPPQYKSLIKKAESLGREKGKKFSVVVVEALVSWYKENSGIGIGEAKLRRCRHLIYALGRNINDAKEFILSASDKEKEVYSKNILDMGKNLTEAIELYNEVVRFLDKLRNK